MSNQFCVVDVSCEKGNRTLFNNVNIDLHAKELLLIIGKNGSGKTALLRQLCGLDAVHKGKIMWNGELINKNKYHYTENMIYIGHQDAIKLDLTVLENLKLDMLLRGKVCENLIDKAMTVMELKKHKDVLARSLSSGLAKRLALARLVLFEIPLWILDEPLRSLDKTGVQLIERLLEKHLAKKGLVIMTNHQPLMLNNITQKELYL